MPAWRTEDVIRKTLRNEMSHEQRPSDTRLRARHLIGDFDQPLHALDRRDGPRCGQVATGSKRRLLAVRLGRTFGMIMMGILGAVLRVLIVCVMTASTGPFRITEAKAALFARMGGRGRRDEQCDRGCLQQQHADEQRGYGTHRQHPGR